MEVTFVGGPLDGQVHDVAADLETNRVIYWPPGAREDPPSRDAPGMEGVFEYLWRGDGSGKADYVAGVSEDPQAVR